MKKMIAILVMLTATIAVKAAPALSGAMTLQQPDGTTVTVWLYGDEHHHWMQTADGTMVVSTQTGCYVADIDTEGRMTVSNMLAHEPQLRTIAERQLSDRQRTRQVRFHEAATQEAARRAQISPTGGYVPHTGSPRILVILAAYKDRDFILPDPVKSFEQYFNGDTQEEFGNHESLNAYSVKRYFDISSGGLFTPQFDIVGPVMLPDSMKYYGGSSASANDEKMGDLAKDAINLVKDQVDFKRYDNDGDGRAELVYVLHAGYGQNTGGSVETMWAKMSTQNIKINDEVTVTRVGCDSELFRPLEQYADFINGIGVFCHEFSHALGMPDLYPTTSSARSVNNQTMEFWSIMDYGIYRRNGFDPTLYNAWEQEVMGWKTIEELTETQSGITLTPILDGGKAYKFGNGANKEEWFILENIQQKGYNTRAYGHGMLVYHIDYPRSDVNMTDNPNNTKGHPRVTVVPADSLLISGYQMKGQSYGGNYSQQEYLSSLAGDPFPGSSNTTQLTDGQLLPGYLFYNGTETTGYSLKNIREDVEAGTVTFNFIVKSKPLKGDANSDGTVDVADVVAIVNKILELPTDDFNEMAADVNGDGTIDVGDVVSLVNIILTQE